MYSVMRIQTTLSKPRCSLGRAGTLLQSETHFVRHAILGKQRLERCAMASKEDTPPTDGSPKPFTNRLRSIPAYQRLKARKQQPQDTGLLQGLQPNAG